jgi:hypothetical protein
MNEFSIAILIPNSVFILCFDIAQLQKFVKKRVKNSEGILSYFFLSAWWIFSRKEQENKIKN